MTCPQLLLLSPYGNYNWHPDGLDWFLFHQVHAKVNSFLVLLIYNISGGKPLACWLRLKVGCLQNSLLLSHSVCSGAQQTHEEWTWWRPTYHPDRLTLDGVTENWESSRGNNRRTQRFHLYLTQMAIKVMSTTLASATQAFTVLRNSFFFLS